MRALLMMAAIASIAPAAHAAAPQVISQGPLVVAGAQSFVLRSERVGRDFLVTVTPPPVAIPLPGQRFAALVALDGGREITAPIGKMLVASALMEPAVIVTVDYPPGQPNLRRIDLTHRPHEVEGRKQGGGGASFQAFLTDELGPFLEGRYAVDLKKSVLFGHSLGGLFTANVLADRPDAFGGYIVASPSVQWDESVVARVAAAAGMGGGRRVMVAVGGQEPGYMVDGAKRIAEALSGPGSAWKTQHKVYADDHHTTYYGTLVLAELPRLMPRIGGMPRSDRRHPPRSRDLHPLRRRLSLIGRPHRRGEAGAHGAHGSA